MKQPSFAALRLPLGILAGVAAGVILGRATMPLPQVNNTVSSQPAAPIAQTASAPIDARHASAAPGADSHPIEADLQKAGNNLGSRAQFDDLLEKLTAWAATDPAAALAYARQHLSFARRDEAVTAILAAWVRQDVRGAWRWVMANTPDNAAYVNSTLGEIAKVSPDAAWSFAAQVAQRNPGQAQAAYVSSLQGMTYAGDFNDAIRLIQSPSSPGLSDPNDLLVMVASEWGHYAPDKAIAWANSLPASLQQQILGSVLGSWAEVDPQAVAEYTSSLPPGNLRSMALTHAVNLWIGQDGSNLNDVANWLSQTNADASYDPVRYKIATAAAGLQSIQPAITWANTIQDEDLKAQALATVINDWQQQDQAAAQSFLQNSTLLSAQTRADVIQKLGNWVPRGE